jgi:hypothetical protein
VKIVITKTSPTSAKIPRPLRIFQNHDHDRITGLIKSERSEIVGVISKARDFPPLHMREEGDLNQGTKQEKASKLLEQRSADLAQEEGETSGDTCQGGDALSEKASKYDENMSGIRHST